MISNDTDKDWEKFGKDDPYFGVLSDDAFKKDRLNPEALERFFASGEEFISEILSMASRLAGAEFRPKSALDFGCGVGRLVIPLSRRCDRVVGVDVSPSMIREAVENCRKRNRTNVVFHDSVQAAGAAGKFDFINSFIVFQHIPPDRGYAILRQLVDSLAPGGVAALHFTFLIRTSAPRRAVGWLRRRFNFVNALINMAKGKALGTPFMQMNGYRMNDLLAVVHDAGCKDSLVSFTNHQGHLGAILVFRKPA